MWLDGLEVFDKGQVSFAAAKGFAFFLGTADRAQFGHGLAVRSDRYPCALTHRSQQPGEASIGFGGWNRDRRRWHNHYRSDFLTAYKVGAPNLLPEGICVVDQSLSLTPSPPHLQYRSQDDNEQRVSERCITDERVGAGDVLVKLP